MSYMMEDFLSPQAQGKPTQIGNRITRSCQHGAQTNLKASEIVLRLIQTSTPRKLAVLAKSMMGFPGISQTTGVASKIAYLTIG